MNILVRSPNWIGDQILAFPFFHHLRAQFPHARIVAVCAHWVSSIQFRGYVDEVVPLLPVGKGRIDQFLALEGVAQQLRRTPWDLAIALPGSFSAAWLLRRSGAAVRRGFTGDGRALLLNDSLRAADFQSLHRSESYVALLKTVDWKRTREFWGVLADNEAGPARPGVLSHFDAQIHWPTEFRHEPPAEPYWVLAPGCLAESRQWGVESFLQLARLVAADRHWPVVIVGGPAERGLAERLMSETSIRWIDLTGKGTVASLAAVFRGARFTVSNDSGLAHVAALCGSPLEVVWGAGDPKHTTPIGPNKISMRFQKVPCWPCEKNTCGNSGAEFLQCLKTLEPAAVWKDMQQVFQLG